MTNVFRVPNAYDQGRSVEARGLERLRAWLTKTAHEGRWIWIAKNGLAELIQRAGADIIIADSDKDWALDCKFIESAKSPDAPFERWSNLILVPGFSKRDFELSHYSPMMIDYRVSKPGWGVTSRADLILVYNLSLDRGVIGRRAAWIELLNTRVNGQLQWQIWKLREQSKYQQPNSSWNVWTPFPALVKRAGYQLFNARQLGFWDKPELTLQLIAMDSRDMT
jgi:hypothetical protein